MWPSACMMYVERSRRLLALSFASLGFGSRDWWPSAEFGFVCVICIFVLLCLFRFGFDGIGCVGHAKHKKHWCQHCYRWKLLALLSCQMFSDWFQLLFHSWRFVALHVHGFGEPASSSYKVSRIWASCCNDYEMTPRCVLEVGSISFLFRRLW